MTHLNQPYTKRMLSTRTTNSHLEVSERTIE